MGGVPGVDEEVPDGREGLPIVKRLLRMRRGPVKLERPLMTRVLLAEEVPTVVGGPLVSVDLNSFLEHIGGTFATRFITNTLL